MAVPAHYLRYAAILGAEDVHGVFRMLKRGKRFGAFENFHANRRAIFGKQLERPLVITHLRGVEIKNQLLICA